MGDNSQILKFMRMMNSTPKYWILSPNAVVTGSHDDGRPFLSPGEVFENKIVLTIPSSNASILLKWMAEKCYDGYYKWEYIGTCDNNLDLSDLDLDNEYDDQYDTNTIDKMRADIDRFHAYQEYEKKAEKKKSAYQTYQDNKYNWMRNFNTVKLNSGSDAGHFQLDHKQAEINNRIFNNASTENIGHDKEDIDMILTNSSTSAVNCSSSISKRLKYIEMKQKKHGTITSQNITITGNYNYTVGISMNQTGGDDCEQSQTVVIKNQKSEKKKEKKESVFGVLHRALINLAKIIERYTRYLLDHCMDNFF